MTGSASWITAAGAGLLLIGLTTGQSFAQAATSTKEQPHYIGTVTANEEENTYAFDVMSVAAAPQNPANPNARTPRYFGERWPDAERNTFGYPTSSGDQQQ